MHQLAELMVQKMFCVREGETVAITGDSGSDRSFADALANATEKAGGKFLILWTPKAKEDGQAGMAAWPEEALTAVLCKVDVWIELQSTILLYSPIWEKAMKENKKLRYLILGDSSIPSLARTFMGFDITLLSQFLVKVMERAKRAKTIRITSKNGTDVCYKTEEKFMFDYDGGDFSKPIFGTAPGYVNIVPKVGSMEGTIVFDLLTCADIFQKEEKITVQMKNGAIAQVEGQKEAEKFKAYLAAFNDPNMFKISHNMLGFNPSVREMRGEIVEDERVWGGVDFGFGHTSPIDMPPLGQPAKSHFDGVVEKTSIYFDQILIVDQGEVVDQALKRLADKLLHP